MKVYCALVYFLKVQKYHSSVKNNLRSSGKEGQHTVLYSKQGQGTEQYSKEDVGAVLYSK